MTRISLMGMAVDRVDEREAVETILDARERDRGGVVLTPNLEHLSSFRSDPEVREAFGEAELVVADGMPLIWASRLQRTPLPERVAGSDLIWSLSEAAAERGRSVFLLGGNPGAAERAADVLQERAARPRRGGRRLPARGRRRRVRPRRRGRAASSAPSPTSCTSGCRSASSSTPSRACGRPRRAAGSSGSARR